MATIAQPNQDEQTGGTPGNPVNQPISGTGAVGTAQGGQTAAAAPSVNQNPVSPVQQNQAPQNNSGYTDVASYLNANPTGGQQIGQGVASNLTQGYNTTMGDINTSAQNATTAATNGYIPENTQLIQQVAANPTAAAADANQTAAYQAQLNDAYTGPTTWADTTNAAGNTVGGYGTLQGEVNTAQQNANLLNTPGGNNVLVQQVENQQNPGQTSQGVNALDTLLFGGTPGAVQAAQTAATPYANLTDYLNTQNTNVGNAIAGGQTNATQTAQDALNALTGANTTLNNAVNATASTDLANAQAQQTQLAADLNNLYGGVAQNTTASTVQGYGGSQNPWYNTQNYNVGQLSATDLASLGITQDQWTALQQAMQGAGTSVTETAPNFGAASPTEEISLANYLNSQNPTASSINAATTATPEQYAEQAAINSLLGSQAPLQTEALNPAMASEAGTYSPANLNSFNYQAALNAAQQTQQAEIQAAQQEANALSANADLQHAESQHGGGFLGGLEQDITHPLQTIASIANPVSWLPNAINTAEGKQVSPTNMNPFNTTSSTVNSVAPVALAAYLASHGPLAAASGATAGATGAAGASGGTAAGANAVADTLIDTGAHGGEVSEDGTIDEYLNKVK